MNALEHGPEAAPRGRRLAALLMLCGLAALVVSLSTDIAAPMRSHAPAQRGSDPMRAAMLAHEAGRFVEAKKHLVQAANDGDLQAQEMLGTMLLLGAPTFPGIQRDPAGAIGWLRLAALRGSSHARFVYCAMTRKPGVPHWGDVRCRLELPEASPADARPQQNSRVRPDPGVSQSAAAGVRTGVTVATVR